MDIGEKLFHLSWRLTKRIKKKKATKAICRLSENKEHYTFLACAINEETITIKKAESCGGIIGDSLFLPESFEYFDSYEDNYRFYQYRILLDIQAKFEGLIFHNERIALNDLKIISLCSHFKILHRLLLEYENITSYVQKLYQEFINNWNDSKDNLYYNSILYYLNDKEKIDSKVYSLIEIIHTPFGNQDELLINAKKLKKELIKINISTQLNPPLLFHLLPCTAQIIKISQKDESSITDGKNDEEKTLKYSKSKERVKKVELDENDPNCNPVYLIKDGVKTADLFSGGKKMIDGHDELNEHLNALEELEIRELSRSSTQAQSVFKADIAVEVDYAQTEVDLITEKAVFLYPEWNFNKKIYLNDWCRVQEDDLELMEDKTEFLKYYNDVKQKYHKEIQELKFNFYNIFQAKKVKNRQLDGNDFDLDSVINARIDYVTGHNPSNKLYVSKHKAPADISFCFLIDSSLSADSYINGKKIMDMTREAIIVLQEVVENILEHTMVAGFYSNTRKKCHYEVIKSFDEKWVSVSSRMHKLIPRGYTRIGPALRHSIYHMENAPTNKKIILLLSDGKPTDYDVYEGKYGINDVRQAVREAKQKGIEVISLAIDKEAKYYFPKLFGAQNYKILTDPKDLPVELVSILEKRIR